MRRTAASLARRAPMAFQAWLRKAHVWAGQQVTTSSFTPCSAAASLSQVRWSHCSCSGDLSLPPPKKVVVEYTPEEVDTFIAFADAVEEEFEGILVDGVEVESGPTAFSIKFDDGRSIFSSSSSSEGSFRMPEYKYLFARMRQAGLQAE